MLDTVKTNVPLFQILDICKNLLDTCSVDTTGAIQQHVLLKVTSIIREVAREKDFELNPDGVPGEDINVDFDTRMLFQLEAGIDTYLIEHALTEKFLSFLSQEEVKIFLTLSKISFEEGSSELLISSRNTLAVPPKYITPIFEDFLLRIIQGNSILESIKGVLDKKNLSPTPLPEDIQNYISQLKTTIALFLNGNTGTSGVN